MDPNRVLSPKAKIGSDGLHKVKNCGDFSIAILHWGESERVGIRWNGIGNNIGFPHTGRYPTWFILPKEVAISYVEKIQNVELLEAIRTTEDKPL